ncbi:hypothetical protein DR74_5347 [Enterobacter cloacae]|nr:hypothetical protein DR74_5347 [Enterobacter cloacae]
MHRIKCGIAFTAGFLLKAVHWLTCCMPLLINVQVINAGLEHIDDDLICMLTVIAAYYDVFGLFNCGFREQRIIHTINQHMYAWETDTKSHIRDQFFHQSYSSTHKFTNIRQNRFNHPNHFAGSGQNNQFGHH